MGIREPKIVIFDLETIPNLREALKAWPRLSQYPGKTMRATITSIVCCGWKILGQKKTHCINAWDYPTWEVDVNDDRYVCEEIYSVLHDADAVITHNGVRFDWKYLQTRLRFHGIPPLSSTPNIDTCLVARKNLLSFDNRLGTLGEWLVGDTKMSHQGWDLWVETHDKDPGAIKIMEKYCKKDVTLLEDVFEKLRPFINNLPNRNHFRSVEQILEDRYVCPSCGSTDFRKWGFHYTKTMAYQRFRCNYCESTFRGDTKEKKFR